MATLELIFYCCLFGFLILVIVLGTIFGAIMFVLMMIRTIKEWRAEDGK